MKDYLTDVCLWKITTKLNKKKAKQKHILVFVLTFLIVISTSIDRLFLIAIAHDTAHLIFLLNFF